MPADASPTNIRRCHATILFADICSSTQLAEICDPESLAEILYRVREAAEQVVSEHHGVINQFYGDGVLAAFGFPLPHENDVLHATEAALALNDAVSRLPLKSLLPKSFRLRVHTGVHAGLIVVQDGDRLQGQYKLYGDALNTAARLADAAAEGEVYASEATLRGVLPYFEVEKLEPLKLKGKGASLPAYRVLRRTGVQTRFEASIRKGLTPFVGRYRELRELEARFRQSLLGDPQVVKVSGDAGLGKTRLVEEFLSSLDDSVRQFKTYCDRDGRAVPLQPFVQIVRQCLDLGAEVLSPPVARLVEYLLQQMGEVAAQFTDTIKQILSLSQQRSGEQLQPAHIAHAVSTLLDACVGEAPAVVFIDDWQWADDLSRQVLGELVRIRRDTFIQIVLASRQEDLSDRALGATGFRLDPFTVKESRAAIASLFANVVQVGLVDLIHDRSGGNALFVEELCQSLRADGTAGEVENKALSEVPATLHGLIESRLERLQPEQLELVRTAAVIGNVVPTWLFERVIGYQLSKDLIIELSHQDLLHLTNGRDQLSFKHGLTRDVIYESVTLRDRQIIHRRVADILQRHVDEIGGDEHSEALAYHYIGAGDDEQALKYAELAGDKALSTMALDRARMQYQSALAAMDRLECPEQNYEHWNAITQRFGWTCVFDPLPEQLAPLQRALELSEKYGGSVDRAKSAYWLSFINYALGRSAEALRHCDKALEGARKNGEKGLEIHVLSTQAQCWATCAEYKKALALFDEVLRLRGYQRDSRERSVGSAYATACRALIVADTGNFEVAQQELELALQSVAGVDAEVEGSIWAVRSCAYVWQGRWRQVLEAADQARENARRITSNYVLGMGTALAGFARWRLDGDARHIDDMIEATNWLEDKSKLLFSSVNYGLLAKASLEKGDFALVRHYAARALMRARHGDRLGEAMAYRAIASLAARDRDRHFKPLHYYLDRALASAQARESRHERAVTALARAEILLLEDPQAAKQLLDHASREFEAMGMDWHLDRARAVLLGN